MSTEVKTSQLIINKLTKEQYEAIVSPSETEIYLTPDESVQAGDNISILNNDAGYQTASDVSSAISTAIENKQDVIEDLETIRSGASLGATALQSFTESDPTVPTHVKSITEADITSWNNKSSFSGSYNDLTDKPTIPTVNNNTITFKQGESVKGTITLNQNEDATIEFDKIIEWGSISGTLADQEDLKEALNSKMSSDTLYGASLVLSMDSSTYVLTATLKDQSGNTLGTAQTVDLPLESVVVSGSYDTVTKEVVLTLKDGSEVRFSVADLVSGLQSEITETNKLGADLVDDTNSTHKFVTEAEKTSWNAKSDFSGDYNDLDNKPTIPTVNDSTITIKQGETIKGSFTLNSENDYTMTLDEAGSTELVEIHGIFETDSTEIILNENIEKSQIISLNLGNTIILPELYSVADNKLTLIETVESGTRWSIVYAKDIKLANIPVASSTTAGVIKVGDNLSIDENGVLNAISDSGKQDVSNLVTSLSAESTDSQYPSAKCVYDIIGNLEMILGEI